MDDMMHSCGESAEAAVNSLSSLLASSFSLGQMVGPLIGSGLTSRFTFPWACTVMAMVLLIHTSVIFLAEIWSGKKSKEGEDEDGDRKIQHMLPCFQRGGRSR